MDGHKFFQWWFQPLVDLFDVVQKAKAVSEIREHLLKSAGPLQERYTEDDLARDCEILGQLMEKQFTWNMDGASYHKMVDESFVPPPGPGGLYGPYEGYTVPDDVKRGWKKERCVAWLSNGDEELQKECEAMHLKDLRKKVEQESSRIKWRVKAAAEAKNQKLYFTPPYVGKLLLPIELCWAYVKYHYKRTPKDDRRGDQAC